MGAGKLGGDGGRVDACAVFESRGREVLVRMVLCFVAVAPNGTEENVLEDPS